MSGAAAAESGWLESLRAFRERHARSVAVAAFVAGFLLDVFTLGRIDSLATILRQGLVIVALGAMLALELLHAEGVFAPATDRARRLWELRPLLTQFLFGGLLRAYTIFYFKSASALGAAVFVPLLGLLMVLVESKRFGRERIGFRVGVYALCVASYFAYLVPIALGRMGGGVFTLSLAVAGAALAVLLTLARRAGLSARGARRGIVYPAAAVLTAFGALYHLQLIPPVPLSLQFVGVFHGVEREGDRYRLLHERSPWKWWERGNPVFHARPGDQVYLFARIFAPRAFRDEVRVRWLKRDARGEWRTWDVIPITILGGREEGFRGYAYKANYEPGHWRVQLETVEGREIGRVRFRITPDASSGERRFVTERM